MRLVLEMKNSEYTYLRVLVSYEGMYAATSTCL
jgi:hypothetical protein